MQCRQTGVIGLVKVGKVQGTLELTAYTQGSNWAVLTASLYSAVGEATRGIESAVLSTIGMPINTRRTLRCQQPGPFTECSAGGEVCSVGEECA